MCVSDPVAAELFDDHPGAKGFIEGLYMQTPLSPIQCVFLHKVQVVDSGYLKVLRISYLGLLIAM